MGDEEGEERQEKQLKDFTAEVDASLPEYAEIIKKNGKNGLPEALDKLLALEKKTRLAADGKSSCRVAVAILKTCVEVGEWKQLSDQITQLCKKRVQMKRVIQAVIQEGVSFVDKTPDNPTKVELIETLRAVSAGKMYAELERARLTKILADMRESQGNVAEACDILQDITVETIGAMEAKEKCDYLLEQLRLCIEKKDYIRAEIIAKKIKTDNLEPEDFQALKVKYYELMIRLHHHDAAYLSISKAYEKIYRTKSIQANPDSWKRALNQAVLYLVLSPFDSEVSDMLQRLKKDPNAQQLPAALHLLTELTKQELTPWPTAFHQHLLQEETFGGEDGQARFKDLHKRIVQHNIRVIGGYYRRIRTPRLAQLLNLDVDGAEEHVSEMVSSKQLYAKIDRPVGIVVFERKQTPNEILNSWSADVSQVLVLVEKTCHMINKETMLLSSARD